MKALDSIHQNYVFDRRIRVLAGHLASMIPVGSTVLDVGCGDGTLALAIMATGRSIDIVGVDVLVREHTSIPVTKFDGVTLPFGDASFETVMFVDVLHHTNHPMVLLKEASRVARGSILIKDHDRSGFLAQRTLKFMDDIGNARFGVSLPYKYLDRQEGKRAFDSLRLVVREERRKLFLYPWPASMVFDRSLHFVACLEHEKPAGVR